MKLFIHYEFQKTGSWAMGTGWLISPDVFVTAGHCSYDWSHKFGRAVEVKAYIGYSGRDSEKSPNVQFKHVKRIVTTEGWVRTRGQKSFDVSFMKVDTPFTGIKPFRYEETPAKGNLIIGVVGYPGDLSDKRTGEKGAHMYEMFLETEFDLAQSADTMLEYQIDTFGGKCPCRLYFKKKPHMYSLGNSGSPVLRQQDLVSIGAHVYGGSFNSASVIGKYGNPYMDYVAAFDLHLAGDALYLVPVTGNTKISAPVPSGYRQNALGSTPASNPHAGDTSKSRAIGNRQVSRQQVHFQHQRRPSAMTRLIQISATSHNQASTVKRESLDSEEFSFMDILKTVGSALPIVGGPIGALAGFALNAASQVAAESTTAESAFDVSTLHEGSMERAILAEATLSVLQSTGLPDDLEESIFSDMKETVMRALPIVRKAAPRVMGAMMEPALKMALDSLHKYNQSGAESFEAVSDEPFRPNILYTAAIDRKGDPRTERFLGSLQSALQQNLQESAIDGDSEEGFFDILKAGTRLVGKGVLFAAKHGLPILLGGDTEAFEDTSNSAATSQGLTADQLAKRALVADAALQAVMKLPPQQLQEEGFFDFIGDAVKKIAPIAMKAIPVVAKAINPTVGGLVSSLLGQEPTFTGVRRPVEGGSPRLPASHGLTAKRSLASLRQDGTPNGGGRGYERSGRKMVY